jgi:hypothetical protein
MNLVANSVFQIVVTEYIPFSKPLHIHVLKVMGKYLLQQMLRLLVAAVPRGIAK